MTPTCCKCGKSAEMFTIRDDDGHSRVSCLAHLGLVVGEFILDLKVFRLEVVATDSEGLLAS